MFSDKRRQFLKQPATTGIACLANSFLGPFAFAQTPALRVTLFMHMSIPVV
jgi:hypothetical protein